MIHSVSTLTGALLLQALSLAVAAERNKQMAMVAKATVAQLEAFFSEKYLWMPATSNIDVLRAAVLDYHESSAYPVQPDPLTDAQQWAFCQILLTRCWIEFEPQIDPLHKVKVYVAKEQRSAEGSTPVEAIFRCYVMLAFGSEVTLSEEVTLG